MDNQQTTKQIPKLEDTERLKELFEYEMTQVRTGFRQELLDLNAEKMNNAGKDISVPEQKEIETPACQINEISVDYTLSDVKTAMANAVPDKNAEYKPELSGIAVPDIPQGDHLKEKVQAAAETVSAPVQTELTLPDAVDLDTVRQAGTYQNTAAPAIGDAERETLDAALSVLGQATLQGDLASLTVDAPSDITLAEITMDKMQSRQDVQISVAAPTGLSVPELKTPNYEDAELKTDIAAVTAPDITLPQTADWSAVSVEAAPFRPELPELNIDSSISAETAEPNIPDHSEVSLPQIPEHTEKQQITDYLIPEQSAVSAPQMPEIGSVSAPDMKTEAVQVDVPQTGMPTIRNLTDAVPETGAVPEDVRQAGRIGAPNMPAPPSVSVADAPQFDLPEQIAPSGIPVPAVSADAEQIKAASPALPDIPVPEIKESAAAAVKLPQKEDFDQIQTDMKQILDDAASARTAGNELLAEIQKAAIS